jgi:RNA recognition motif-containing protein
MQATKLYVGNLSYNVTPEDLKELFSAHGEVLEVKIIEGKGFGFIEMETQAEAEAVRKELDGTPLKGRNLKINLARPPKARRGRGGRRN